MSKIEHPNFSTFITIGERLEGTLKQVNVIVKLAEPNIIAFYLPPEMNITTPEAFHDFAEMMLIMAGISAHTELEFHYFAKEKFLGGVKLQAKLDLD
ncbi:hypothetical protein ACFOG5_24900 [Pedobacter fastidiosus]|uniref:Uncharacterized protein n=1 Tax=Pedobacter fastidiosus TaxID=2765361 RepID=A0ABR7KSV9_9SPHI|nr:hypothetical protein [Pedobacter fastidiosus]MBC6110872.1 hypothetical protein [Pedobacter fastidiosus]